MGSLILQMGVCILIGLISLSCNLVNSQIESRHDVLQGSVFIDGKNAIAKIDSDFICATMDWWPPEKCDYGTCSWGHASLLNVVFFLLSLLNSPCVCLKVCGVWCVIDDITTESTRLFVCF